MFSRYHCEFESLVFLEAPEILLLLSACLQEVMFSATKVGRLGDFGVHLHSCLSVPDFISSCPHFLARRHEQTQTVKRRTRSSIIYGVGVSKGEY
jgi:hypothetical protein